MEKEIKEIPFGAKDSELCKFEYTIPDGYEARIENGKVIVRKKKSEDERIRKRICLCLDECVHSDIICDYERDECLAYLEKQKEQKPAEWSEEDETAFSDLMWCIEKARKSAKDENDMGNIWFAENWVKNRLKSLRPQPHWKPSMEQMEALLLAIEGKCPPTSYMSRRLEDLYDGLVNTFDVDEKYLGNNKIDETD